MQVQADWATRTDEVYFACDEGTSVTNFFSDIFCFVLRVLTLEPWNEVEISSGLRQRVVTIGCLNCALKFRHFMY